MDKMKPVELIKDGLTKISPEITYSNIPHTKGTAGGKGEEGEISSLSDEAMEMLQEAGSADDRGLKEINMKIEQYMKRLEGDLVKGDPSAIKGSISELSVLFEERAKKFKTSSYSSPPSSILMLPIADGFNK